ncbi:retrovirus-related pol polyprotein from transposon TNT 1-94 [Tanacetum coccineum]
MIALRVRDVYVFDMTSSAQESCFFAKASDNLNWLWHKRLAHLNFKIINKLTKQNLVIGLPSLVYSKDKPCSSCEKGKHHRANFKTKQTSSMKKYLHLLYMDLFGPVTPRSINHEKYTLVIVDEYSRYTWIHFLKKKSQAPKTIMSFIKRVENQNDIKVKQLRTDIGGIRGDIAINTFRNALRAHYLPHSSVYVSPPSITIVRPWFVTIGYSGENGAKGTLKKSCLPPRYQGKSKKSHLIVVKEICRKAPQVLVSYLERQTCGAGVLKRKSVAYVIVEVADGSNHSVFRGSQGKKPEAKSGLKRKQSSKDTSESKTEVSKSKTGQSKKDTQSSSTKEKSPSHPSPPTPVVGEMHKEAQQAAGGPTSLGATSEEGAHPQLSSGSNLSVLVDKTKSAGDGLKTAHTDSGANEESRADDISLKVKLEDLSDILKDTRSAFFTPDSPPDEPIIVSDESEEEEEVAKDKDTEATSHDVPKDTSVPPPPSPKSAQIQELMAQVHLLQSQKEELEQAKAKAKAEVLLLNITGLSGEIKELKKHVRDMEIELPGDLKEIPTKLETFTSTISSLSSQLKTLDFLPRLLHKVTNTLNMFATMMENALGAPSMNVLSAGKAIASPAEGEKNTKDAEANLQKQLINLLGIEVAEQYNNKKLLFDKYCDKLLKRKKSPKITNCKVLAKKGPITLKIYREDGSDEVISNLKTRLDQLTQTEQELKIDLNKPLKEQDPLNELNELANKKRKRTSDLKDHSMSTKKHKSSSSA